MTSINAAEFTQKELLQLLVNTTDEEIEINNVCGQRYIGCGWENKRKLVLHGTAGNNLAAFAEGIEIILYGNSQDGVANTMSQGKIIVHGRVGDIAGYGMRGGELFIRDNAGYRLGIHMKAYQDRNPIIVVGGSTGAFTGEYMAGGKIIVLGLNDPDELIGQFCATGMYAGSIYLRGNYPVHNLAKNVKIDLLSADQLTEIKEYLEKYARYFNYPLNKILAKPFTRLSRPKEKTASHSYKGFVS